MFTGVLTGLEELGFAAALLLLDSWWQSLALMGGLWLALRLWRGVNAATRYALWCAALLGIVCLPLLHGVGFIKKEDLARRVGVSVQGETKWGNGVVRLESPPVVAMSKSVVEEENTWSVPLVKGAWAVWLVPVWGLGSLLLLLRLGDPRILVDIPRSPSLHISDP